MNYARARNPERLLRLAGFTDSEFIPAPVVSASDSAHTWPGPGLRGGAAAEARFLNDLHHRTADELRDLIVLMGGFSDGSRGHAYRILREFPAKARDRYDFYYREHPESRAARELIELYHLRGRKIILMGHSWGGDAAVHGVALKTFTTIDLLVTFDPVSRKPLVDSTPHNVTRWINIYLNYLTATWVSRSNIVARIGGPWEYTPGATENIVTPAHIPHDDALSMFLMLSHIHPF